MSEATVFGKDIFFMSRVIRSSIERFYWDNGFSKAAALAYSSLLSLVPITFLIFGFLASFAVSNQDLLKIREFIFQQFVPNQQTVSAILDKLTEIDQTLNSSSFSVLALAFFAITALLLINSIEYTLNEIWQVFEPRTISQRLSIFCAILVIGPVLLVSTYYTTKLRIEPFLMGIEVLQPFSGVYNHLISFAIDFFAFFLFFYLIPNAPVKTSPALFGAAVTAILFDVAKFYFAFYILHFTSYDKLYGAFAVIPVFLFWLYLSWIIILFGCEASFQFQNLPPTGSIWKKQVTAVGDGAVLLAVQALVLIGKSFSRGDNGYSELELSELLGCSTIVFKPIVEALKNHGILLQSEGREATLVLSRAPQLVTFANITAAVSSHGNHLQLTEAISTFFTAHHAANADSISLDKLLL